MRRHGQFLSSSYFDTSLKSKELCLVTSSFLRTRTSARCLRIQVTSGVWRERLRKCRLCVLFICSVIVIMRLESYSFLIFQLHYKTERLRMYASQCTDAINHQLLRHRETRSGDFKQKLGDFELRYSYLVQWASQIDGVCGSSVSFLDSFPKHFLNIAEEERYFPYVRRIDCCVFMKTVWLIRYRFSNTVSLERGKGKWRPSWTCTVLTLWSGRD